MKRRAILKRTFGWASVAASTGLAGLLLRDRLFDASQGDAEYSGRFPNVLLHNHEGREVRFYDELLKDRIVLIDMIHGNGSAVSEQQTANLARLQELEDLSGLLGREVFMYSITLDPERDTPAALRRYAERHGAHPHWQFLTGRARDIERIRKALGFGGPGTLVYGNESLDRWGGCPSLSKPNVIAKFLLHDVVPAERRPSGHVAHLGKEIEA